MKKLKPFSFHKFFRSVLLCVIHGMSPFITEMQTTWASGMIQSSKDT